MTGLETTAPAAALTPDEAAASRAGARMETVELLAIVILALLPRLIQLWHPHSFYDELRHVLAARALLEHGTLQIADGPPYTRASLFTYATAAMFRLFGESLAVGRIIPALAGAATVIVLFAWLRATAGRTAAWVAALLLTADPLLLQMARVVRFYTVQMLAFLLGVIAVHEALAPGRTRRRRATMLGTAAALFLLALHLQIITAAGLLALGAWVAAVVFLGALRHYPRRRVLTAAGVVAGVGLLGIIVLAASGTLGAVAQMYATAPPHARAHVGEWQYYYWRLRADYATIINLLPLLALLAVARYPKQATLSALLFGSVLLFHSFAAFKEERFLLYIRPFLFALVGLGVAAVLPALVRVVEELTAWWTRGGARWRRGAAQGLIALALLFAFAVLPGVAGSRILLLREARALATGTRPNDTWGRLQTTLSPYVAAGDAILSTTPLQPLYFLGRVDGALYNGDKRPLPMPGYDGRHVDTGRPMITTVAGMKRVLADHRSVLVIADEWRWSSPLFAPALRAYITEHMVPVPVPGVSGMHVFRWTQP